MNSFVLKLATLFLLFSTSNAFALDTVYLCNGTQEVSDIFGDVLFTFTESGNGDYSLSLTMDGISFAENTSCSIDPRLSGVRGVMNLICIDENGDSLPVEFNTLTLSLTANFAAPGLGSIPLEATCKKQ